MRKKREFDPARTFHAHLLEYFFSKLNYGHASVSYSEERPWRSNVKLREKQPRSRLRSVRRSVRRQSARRSAKPSARRRKPRLRPRKSAARPAARRKQPKLSYLALCCVPERRNAARLISQRSLGGAIEAGNRNKATAAITGSSLPPISLFKGASLMNPARKRRVFCRCRCHRLALSRHFRPGASRDPAFQRQ